MLESSSAHGVTALVSLKRALPTRWASPSRPSAAGRTATFSRAGSPGEPCSSSLLNAVARLSKRTTARLPEDLGATPV